MQVINSAATYDCNRYTSTCELCGKHYRTNTISRCFVCFTCDKQPKPQVRINILDQRDCLFVCSLLERDETVLMRMSEVFPEVMEDAAQFRIDKPATNYWRIVKRDDALTPEKEVPGISVYQHVDDEVTPEELLRLAPHEPKERPPQELTINEIVSPDWCIDSADIDELGIRFTTDIQLNDHVVNDALNRRSDWFVSNEARQKIQSLALPERAYFLSCTKLHKDEMGHGCVSTFDFLVKFSGCVARCKNVPFIVKLQHLNMAADFEIFGDVSQIEEPILDQMLEIRAKDGWFVRKLNRLKLRDKLRILACTQLTHAEMDVLTMYSQGGMIYDRDPVSLLKKLSNDQDDYRTIDATVQSFVDACKRFYDHYMSGHFNEACQVNVRRILHRDYEDPDPRWYVGTAKNFEFVHSYCRCMKDYFCNKASDPDKLSRSPACKPWFRLLQTLKECESYEEMDQVMANFDVPDEEASAKKKAKTKASAKDEKKAKRPPTVKKPPKATEPQKKKSKQQPVPRVTDPKEARQNLEDMLQRNIQVTEALKEDIRVRSGRVAKADVALTSAAHEEYTIKDVEELAREMVEFSSSSSDEELPMIDPARRMPIQKEEEEAARRRAEEEEKARRRAEEEQAQRKRFEEAETKFNALRVETDAMRKELEALNTRQMELQNACDEWETKMAELQETKQRLSENFLTLQQTALTIRKRVARKLGQLKSAEEDNDEEDIQNARREWQKEKDSLEEVEKDVTDAAAQVTVAEYQWREANDTKKRLISNLNAVDTIRMHQLQLACEANEEEMQCLQVFLSERK